MSKILTKIGDVVKYHQRDLLVTLALGLVAWSFYNIGRISGNTSEPVSISSTKTQGTTGTSHERTVPLDTRVVISKSSSSKKYHYSWCSSGKRIKPENQAWFETATLAEAAGYTLAGNCR